MLEILKKTLKTGCQTTKYPDVPEAAPRGFRGKPQFLPDKCTFCGDCVAACPPGVIWLTVINDKKTLSLSCCGCIFCGRCEEVCKYGAVTLTGDFELASKTKEDLIASIRSKP